MEHPMNTLLALAIFASLSNGSSVQTANAVNPQKAGPALLAVPKPPKGLTLYNASGEIVARCGRKGDSFADCKMESGATLDDLMNAWVHAYRDSQK
jgi:hypothetical protein